MIFYKLRKKFWNKVLILCYHRVEDYLSDPINITVSQKNFIDQIKWLNQNYSIISLDQLEEYLLFGISIPRQSIVITFDDGYQSYYKTIRFLNKYSVFCTFFICTPTISKKYFYWDILTDLLIDHKKINKEKLEVINNLCVSENINIEPEVSLDDFTYYKTLQWKIYENTYPSNRCKLFELLVKKAEFTNYHIKNSILKKLYGLKANVKNDKSFFIKDDAIDLTKCHIGAHTLNHNSLSNMKYIQQESEILQNKKKLEEMFGSEIKYFAYPFGSRDHYNKKSISIVKANFNLGLSNFPGLVHKHSNRYELPRFLVRDWSLSKFKEKINTFYNY